MMREMRLTALTLLALPTLAAGAALRHYDVVASFVPARKPQAQAQVSVSFQPLDPDLRLNESPAPRLKLDETQTVLVDKQPKVAASVPDFDPASARYLDVSRPVSFPVAIAPTAPKGEQEVRATVIFFYCSHREAWCRRGTADVLIPVTVR
jgi:hypothetical protein